MFPPHVLISLPHVLIFPPHVLMSLPHTVMFPPHDLKGQKLLNTGWRLKADTWCISNTDLQPERLHNRHPHTPTPKRKAKAHDTSLPPRHLSPQNTKSQTLPPHIHTLPPNTLTSPPQALKGLKLSNARWRLKADTWRITGTNPQPERLHIPRPRFIFTEEEKHILRPNSFRFFLDFPS